ncbi:MAG: BamA/TamA family outer membrane protein [bacterium]|nr:BamA/TamA family outer membrane protein [bacterium]
MVHLRALLLLLAWLLPALLPGSVARADFTLEEYDQWQRYTGWPIRVIEFPGIHNFARADLLEIMATEKPTWLRRYVPIGSRTVFYPEDFAADLLRVKSFYRREGFPAADVRGKVLARDEKQDLRLIVEISEGAPLILRSWSIAHVGNPAGVDSARWSRALPIRTGKRLAESQLEAAVDSLRQKLRAIGHARAVVFFDTANVRNDSADVVFKLAAGPYCKFGRTKITGLKQVSEGTARRELAYEENEPYTPLKLDETRRNLLRLETFRMVRADVNVEGDSDTLDVLIRTEEGNRYLVRLGTGYDKEEGMHVSGKLTDLNFFGRGRRFTMDVSASDILDDTLAASRGLLNDERFIDRRVGFTLFWPHTPLNSTDISIKPSWEYEFKAGTIIRTQSATTRLSALPLPKVAASFANEFGRQDVLVDTTNAENVVSTISIETIDLAWDTRDNPLVPRRGHMLSATFSESGALWSLENRWWRAQFAGRVLVPINQFTVFAMRGAFGLMGPLHQSAETPVQERLRLGGVTNVRGWGRDLLAPRADDDQSIVLGGDQSAFASFEVQRDVWGPVGLIVFSDLGNVWTKARETRLDDLYTTAGAGLRFLTLIGPIRLDFGYQLRQNPYGDKPWAYHILLGSAF